MKIAILTTVHPPLDGRIFYKQALSLAKAGHQVTYIAPHDTQATLVAEEEQIIYIPFTVHVRQRMARPKRWLELMALLHKNTFDVWHFHDPELLPLTVVWKFLFAPHVHLIYDLHEDLPKNLRDKLWIPRWLRGLVARAAEHVETWGIRQCSAVIAATDGIEQRVGRSAQYAVTVHNYPLLANSASLPLAQKKKQSNLLRVIYVGSMTPTRGIREIVQAMTYLTDIPVLLVLVGEFWPAPFEQEILSLAGSNVEIVGKIPFTKVPAQLADSDIGIICLHATPAYVESLPIKLFEYMQAGLPVIASDFPMWRQILDGASAGVFVDPTNPHQIAEAIRSLALHPEQRSLMGKMGQKAVNERYSWQSEEHILLAVYQKLASTSLRHQAGGDNISSIA